MPSKLQHAVFYILGLQNFVQYLLKGITPRKLKNYVSVSNIIAQINCLNHRFFLDYGFQVMVLFWNFGKGVVFPHIQQWKRHLISTLLLTKLQEIPLYSFQFSFIVSEVFFAVLLYPLLFSFLCFFFFFFFGHTCGMQKFPAVTMSDPLLLDHQKSPIISFSNHLKYQSIHRYTFQLLHCFQQYWNLITLYGCHMVIFQRNLWKFYNF